MVLHQLHQYRAQQFDTTFLQGVAAAMIEVACEHASLGGVTDMYVHVAVDNESAAQLYKRRCRFDSEQVETAELARSLNRPKRELLRRSLTLEA